MQKKYKSDIHLDDHWSWLHNRSEELYHISYGLFTWTLAKTFVHSFFMVASTISLCINQLVADSKVTFRRQTKCLINCQNVSLFILMIAWYKLAVEVNYCLVQFIASPEFNGNDLCCRSSHCKAFTIACYSRIWKAWLVFSVWRLTCIWI
jgi:hypothetical protein